jgi:hypothetical protein
MNLGNYQQTSHSEALETLREMTAGFCVRSNSFILAGLFNIPQYLTTWDRRLYFASEGSRAMDFYRPQKSHRPRLSLNPRILGPMASTLPVDHRGRLLIHTVW